MRVEVIESTAALTALRENWERIYNLDADAQIYLSWSWMNSWLARMNDMWFILAARRGEGEPYVGFLPLQLRTETGKDGRWYNDIRMGGAEFADYYGFICDPKFEEEVAIAFGNHLRHLNWTNLRIEKFYGSDKRLRTLTKPLSKTLFNITDKEEWMNDNTIHNNIYPFVKLPADWETYLNEKLSTNTRQKAKRFLKRLDESGEFRITHPTEQTLKKDITTLLKMWEDKWRPTKGDKVVGIMRNYHVMFGGLFKTGNLFLPILWKGDKPLAALGTLLDPSKKMMHFVITGRDETFNSPPPGFMLHCYSIRWAIQNGFKEYDFLMGNEPYKYMFGCEDRYIRWVIVSTKTNKNLGEVLDKRSCPKIYNKAVELHKEGKIDKAETALRQIIEADDKFADAFNLLAQIEAGRARDKEAMKLYKSYLALKPNAHDAWFKLGKVQEAQGDKDGAIQSYRKVLELDPKNRDVQLRLLQLYPLKTPPAAPQTKPLGILAR